MAARRIATPLAVLALLASLLCGSAHAVPPPPPLITNGDFESSTLSPWVPATGIVMLADDTWWTAASGTQSVEIRDYGSLYQDIATTAGQRYDLSFAYAGDPGCTQGVKHLTVSWNGTLIGVGAGSATYTFDTTGHSAASMGWQTAHVLVDAASASTHLVFTDDVDSGCGIVVDKVAMASASGTQTGTQLTASSANTPVGEPLTLTATVLGASSGTTPTGSVQFAIDGAPTGPPVGLSSGQAQITLSDLTPDSYLFTATYSPDSASFSSSSVAQRFGIAKGTTVTDLAVDSSPAPLGADVILTATVGVVAGKATPTGTVQFSDEYGPLGDPVPLEPDGTAQLAIQEDVGDHYLWAAYSGDDNVIPSLGYAELSVYDPAPVPAITDRLVTTTSVVSSKNPVAPGEQYTVTATVSPGAVASAPLDGTIAFFVGAVAVGDPIALDNNRSASVTLTAPSALTGQLVRARYSGNAYYRGSAGSVSEKIVSPPASGSSTPPPRDTEIPIFTADVTPVRLASALRRGIRVHIDCNENCSATARLSLTARQAKAFGMKVRGTRIVVGEASYYFVEKRAFDLVIRFSARSRKALAKARRVALRLTTTAEDLAGNDAVHARTLTLKR